MKSLSAFAGSLLACTVLLLGVAQAEIKDRTLRFAFVNNVGHPQEQGAKKFADLVAERSGRKIKVALFPGGQLGGDLQVVSALQGGNVVDLTVLKPACSPASTRSSVSTISPSSSIAARSPTRSSMVPSERSSMA